MKLDIPLNQLRYFLQDDLYLLNADKQAYINPQPQQNLTVEELPVAASPKPVSDKAPTPPAPVIDETPAITFKYLGGNQKRFLVLCHYPTAEYMAEAHLTALLNTVTRLNFTQQDLAIVNLFNYPAATYQELLNFFNPAKLLVLGAAALPAGLPSINQNEVQAIAQCQALYTFSFDEMMGNKENTKAFWNQIKTF